MRFTLIYGTNRARPSLLLRSYGYRVPAYPPLGLLYIAGALEQAGHTAEIIDFYVDPDPYHAIDESILRSDAVGVSVDNDTFTEATELAHYIKTKDPGIPVVIGGPHCTLYPEQSLRNIPDADISVIGDGECAIVAIADALKGKRQLSDIPGIVYKDREGIHSGKPVQFLEDIESLPLPARHLVKHYEYGKVKSRYFFKPPVTSIITARGCPFECRYCIRHIISYKKFRKRSVPGVLAELQTIYDQGYRSVMIADDTFLADQKRAMKIMQGLIAMGSPMEILIGGTRADATDRALYETMKRAGVTYVCFGIEAGTQDVLDFYRKRLTLDQIRTAVRLCDEMGFFTHGTFILGAPLEDRKHIQATITFAHALPLDSVTFYILTYRHGSDLWQEAFNQGKIPSDVYETYADTAQGLSPFTTEELFKFCRGATQRFFYRPRYLYHLFSKALATHDVHMIGSAMDNLVLSLRLPFH